ncbi:MAG: sodium:proline symporter, partial [Planctomycetia bacterium]|nr:sodium:proline symporter [Planctomycetia bacterium]
MAAIDWVIVGAYLAFALGVGIFFARRAGKSTNEFFISGRNLPWWIAGTSMVATSFASDTPLLITGIVRNSGISFNWLWWSFAIGGMFSVFLLSRLWRRACVVTDVELTELRYGGGPARVLRACRGAHLALIVNVFPLVWVTLAMMKLMSVLLDIHPLLAVGICLALTLVYAVLSGFWGVVVTDLLQFVIAMVGSVVLCVIAVSRVGGLARMREGAVGESPLGESVLHFFPRPPVGTGPLDSAFWMAPIFAFAVFMCIQWWANKYADGGGVIIQRMSASK